MLKVRDAEGYRLLKTGQIRGRQLANGQWRIHVDAVKEYLTPSRTDKTPRHRASLNGVPSFV
jgi:predicted site-specific integrase-resolvase